MLTHDCQNYASILGSAYAWAVHSSCYALKLADLAKFLWLNCHNKLLTAINFIVAIILFPMYIHA